MHWEGITKERSYSEEEERVCVGGAEGQKARGNLGILSTHAFII